MATTPESPRDSPVHFPGDRRPAVWIRPTWLVLLAALAVLALAAAWGQYLLSGLPPVPAYARAQLEAAPGPHGFPAWLRVTHFANFLLMTLLIRSGLSILVDHPRLYANVGCTPGTEWARFTPLAVPTDRLWTAKDDARYLTPWLGLPGFRHTVGLARHWHFLSDLFWVLTGVLYVTGLFASGHWVRLVPTSWHVFPDAWAVFVHYATFHLPPEPDGFYRYNVLQQVAYFGVIFVMAPLSILSGAGMSPAIDNRFAWYARLFGGRQGARSLHFLLMAGYAAFIAVHVTLVVMTGFARNMNHIVLGTDGMGALGLILGLVGIAAVAAACALAHRMSWRHPRAVQQAAQKTVGALKTHTLGPLVPRAEYRKRDISPFFWPNGKAPTSAEWTALAADDFRDYRLRVFGLVENPVEWSLDDLRALGERQQITMHHCIQGWTGIAEWGGLPLTTLLEHVRPLAGAKVVVFHSFGEGLYGGEYYETHTLANIKHPQSLLAYTMNSAPLSSVYGAPLRLRVENQLGYKMAKWIQSIEFVADVKEVGQGYGGKNEDDEYFDLDAGI